MRRSNVGVRDDALAQTANSVAKLQVLELASREMPFVVTAGSLEHRAAYNATGRRECERVVGIAMVMIALDFASILRQEPRRHRRGVARSEHSTDVRLLHQDGGGFR